MIPEGHTIEDIKKREEIITSMPQKFPKHVPMLGNLTHPMCVLRGLLLKIYWLFLRLEMQNYLSKKT